MSAKDKVFLFIVGVGLLAVIHFIYLYFWVYGDVIHAQLTPKEWFSMYGVHAILVCLAALSLEIARER